MTKYEMALKLRKLIEVMTDPDTINLLKLLPQSYIAVGWPESQNMAEEDWFEEECVLDISEDQMYLVPIERYLNYIQTK